MFNPFKKLTIQDVENFLNSEKYYAVAQHYKRAFPNYTASNKTALLITAHKYLSDAERNLNNLEDKRHSAIIHLNHQTHFARLQQLLSANSQYLLFNGCPQNIEDILKKSMEVFKPKLLAFFNRDVDIDPVLSFPITPVLSLINGEFYISIGEGFQKQLIKLEIIENV